jgi:hypothetical protein
MARIVLVHWNAAEARQRTARLMRAGHDVELYSTPDGERLRAFSAGPPDAFVIDLDRLPSHGRAVGTALRQDEATRTVPLLFVGGDGARVERTRVLLPDAVYTDWGHVLGELRAALRRRPARPIVPGTVRGYSGTPLVKKLGIRPEDTLVLLGAPEGFESTLGQLPPGARVRRDARSRGRVLLLFVRSRPELARRFPVAARALEPGGRLWLVWPKKAAGLDTDLREADVRAFGLGNGFVDYKICAVDATWSGLCFARRPG